MSFKNKILVVFIVQLLWPLQNAYAEVKETYIPVTLSCIAQDKKNIKFGIISDEPFFQNYQSSTYNSSYLLSLSFETEIEVNAFIIGLSAHEIQFDISRDNYNYLKKYNKVAIEYPGELITSSSTTIINGEWIIRVFKSVLSVKKLIEEEGSCITTHQSSVKEIQDYHDAKKAQENERYGSTPVERLKNFFNFNES
jgi:hypothetical protein